MAIVTGLFIYPVKSCGGIKLSEAHLLETGLAHDRQWMLVDADGRFVTQRTHPAMALIQTALEADVLRLRHPAWGQTSRCPCPTLMRMLRPVCVRRCSAARCRHWWKGQLSTNG